MARKIFITYKYGDRQVYPLTGLYDTRVRDYVTILQTILAEDQINKGEEDDEDLSMFKDETIASRLRDKIYDSSLTIAVISPLMKNVLQVESDQWIPWEVSYSLKEHSRGDRVSRSNAMLAIALPNQINRYDYFIVDNSCPFCNCRTLKTEILFGILSRNMFNIKNPAYSNCTNHTVGNKPYLGNACYIPSVKWIDFLASPSTYIDLAYSINENIESYNVSKSIT